MNTTSPAPPLSRRSALRSLLATAALASRPLNALLAAPSTRRFRIGACEWSLGKSDPTCFDRAREIGLDGVQVDFGNPTNELQLRRPEIQKLYQAAAERTGLSIASLAMAVLNQHPLKGDPRTALWLLDAIHAAAALGVRVVLLAQFHHGDLKGDTAGIDRTVGVLKELAPRAEKAGVVLGVENYLSAAENLRLLDRVGSAAVQVYYDVGNSTDQGYDIYQEIRDLKGRICEFHAKDGPHRVGHGRVDFRRVREAMEAIDYSGWIQLETAVTTNLVADYRADANELRRHLNSTP